MAVCVSRGLDVDVGSSGAGGARWAPARQAGASEARARASSAAQRAAKARACSLAGSSQHPDRVLAAAARRAWCSPQLVSPGMSPTAFCWSWSLRTRSGGRRARRLRRGAGALSPPPASGVGRPCAGRERLARCNAARALTVREGFGVFALIVCVMVVRGRCWRPSRCRTDEHATAYAARLDCRDWTGPMVDA